MLEAQWPSRRMSPSWSASKRAMQLNMSSPPAEAAGASPSVAQAIAAALPLGEAALAKVQGLTTAIATAAGAAFVESYVQGVK